MDTLKIVSTNYTGQSAVITYYPDTGGTINLGTQVLPYDYVASYFYGTYSLFFPAFGSTCTLYVEDLSGNFLLQENGDYIFQENYSKIIIETGPSPTPTVTPTSSTTPSTVIPSVTPTMSVTPSLTPTPSVTLSVTPSISVTPSMTSSLTPSVTPSVTPTSSLTPSVTPSITPTSSVTPSVTTSITPSLTPSVTSSVTPTPSVTPSVTSSVTPSVTTSSSVTPTLSLTPSLTPTSSITPTPTPSPPSNLIVYLDSGNLSSYSGTGSTWYDLQGVSNDATLINTPTYSSNFNGILNFDDASSEYATIPNIGNLSNWTVEVWFRLTSAIGTKVSSIVSNQFDLVNKLNFSIGTNNAPTNYNISAGFFNGAWRTTSGFAPSTNVWYQVVGTYDGSVIRQYVNGVASGGTLNYVGTPQSGGEIRLMRRWDDTLSSSNLIDGDLAIVKIYNTALNSSQVLQNYNDNSSRFVIPSPTPSVTPTISPTPSVTPTVTPSITPSLTPTSSVTPSVTPSITPSITPTSSVTPSVTPSRTPSVTPTSSVTPSVTPSRTPSVTPSRTPSVTPSLTPSITTTSSVTPSITPTPSRPAFTYYRWQITETKIMPPNANAVQSSEFAFQIGGVDQSWGTVTVTNPGGNNPAGEEPSKLVDGSLLAKALDLNFVSNGNVTNFIFQFATARAFTGYRWGTANDEEGRDPKSWTIAGSNDGTTWTTLHTVSGFSATVARDTWQTSQTY